MYSGYGITFDSASSWSFDNDTNKNVIIFGVDNSSSSHADNWKNNFLVLDEGPTFEINGNFGSLEKNLSINFNIANTKFCFKSLSLKPTIKMLTFQLNFVSKAYLMDLVPLSLETYL